MSPPVSIETIAAPGCSISLRRFQGPEALELFFSCQPTGEAITASGQAEAIYRAILELLAAEGSDFGALVSETLYLRNLQANLHAVRSARQRVLTVAGAPATWPATGEIEQAPLNERACLEVLMHAIIPHRSPLRIDTFEASLDCDCDACSRAHGCRFQLGDQTTFRAAALCGSGDNAYEQTQAMFGLAEKLLHQAGMQFGDVVRAWIHLREMERDYAELNRARREFFTARGIAPVPASTGIGGGPASASHDLCLGIYAVKAATPPLRTVMTSPTLNEAGEYGADFVRGMKVVEANKVALHVSGTASIDAAGRTAHVGDFEAQADRMLVNVAALLERQGASYGNIVSAITYLKHPADARRLREKFQQAGYAGFPHVLVAAQVCRPELLCETEALAILPAMHPATTKGD